MKLLEEEIRKSSLKARFRVIGPSLVLLLGLIATALFARYAQSVVDETERLRFNSSCRDIEGHIYERLLLCETVLRAGAAFIDRNGSVSREEWHRFVELQSIESNMPGIQGVGFAVQISRQDLMQHTLSMRAAGFPAYQVRPEGEREIYSSIVYLEPFTDRNLLAFGYDMLSEPVRRTAMEMARDRNVPILSGKVVLQQETNQDIQAGNLMYMPVFRRGMPIATVAERRVALLGWVYSPYRMGNLMRGIMRGHGLTQNVGVHLEIFDGELVTHETRLYDNSPAEEQQMAAAHPLRLQRRLALAGHAWTLRFTNIWPSASVLGFTRFGLVWFGGATTSLFACWLLFSLLNTRFKALQLAGQLTADLKSSEENFRAIADYTVEWETWFGVNGEIRWVNPAVERITGYSPAEVLATPDFIATLITPENRDTFTPFNKKVVFEGSGENLELNCIRKNGEKFWLNISWQPIYDKIGNPFGIRASGRDITKFKETEANLLRSNWVVDQATTSIMITDACGNIEYVNAEFTRITGYTKDEVLCRNPRFLQSGQTSRATYDDLWETLVAGGSWHGEFQNRKKNGEIYWETVAISPVRDPLGHVTQYVAIKQDVTERKRLQLALQESEARHAQLAEESGTFVWAMDAQGLFTYVNAVAEKILGYRPDELLGKMHFCDLHPAAGRDAFKGSILAALERKQPFRDIDSAAQTKEGRPIRLSTTGTPLLNGDGSLLGFNGSSQDITARWQAEMALKAKTALLEAQTNASLDGILVVDGDQKRILINQRFSELFDVPRHILDDDDNTALLMHMVSLAKNADAFLRNAHNLAAKPDAIERDEIEFKNRMILDRYSAPVLGKDGEYYGRIWTFRDITVRRLVEKALEESLTNFRTFFESIGDMIFVGQPDGNLIYANQAVSQTLGYSTEELMTMHVLDVHPKDRRKEAETIFGAMFRGERDSCPLPLAHKDGGLVPVETRVWFGQWNGANCLFGISKNLSAEQEAKQLFERLFRNNPALMALSNLPGREFIDVSDSFLQTLGYTRDEVIGKTAEELAIFTDAKQAALLAEELAGQGRINNTQLQVRRKDGQIRIGLFSGEIIQSHGRRLFLTVMNDITELQQAQMAVKTLNERMHLAAQAGGVGIWDYNAADGQLVWDEQMIRLYGLTKGQFSGVYAAWQQGIHPADRQRGDEEIQAALRGEKNFDTEFRVVWPDGSIHDIRALAIVQRDDSGEPLSMVGTNWDITSEKQAAAALRRSETLLQLTFRSSPFGFLVVDNRTDAILHFNERFCEIWGIGHLADRMRRGELKNNDIIPDCLHVLADVPAFAASCAGLQDEAQRTVLEDEIAFTHDRTIRRFTTQIRDDSDQYHGRFYIFEEITVQKRSEKLVAASLEKERQVSEMKTRFISITSHEFRTPMATVMMSAELLINHFDRFAQPKRLEMLGRIMSSVHRMTEMLDEMLTLNRLEERRTEVHLAPIDLQTFVLNLIEEIRLGAGNAHRFESQTTGDVSAFSTDTKLLHHIVDNLLSNAVRYSPAGTDIAIRVEADAKRMQLSVEDHGIGIPKADRARIFEPFERGSNVGNIQGTGLGMSIVKGMTTLLGGTIDLAEVKGGGSRFTLTLPRLDGPVRLT
jgi:PAS domain S-box-containing protein